MLSPQNDPYIRHLTFFIEATSVKVLKTGEKLSLNGASDRTFYDLSDYGGFKNPKSKIFKIFQKIKILKNFRKRAPFNSKHITNICSSENICIF